MESVYLCVCINTVTVKSLDVGSSGLQYPVYLEGIRVNFVYDGHRVKVTGAKKG